MHAIIVSVNHLHYSISINGMEWICSLNDFWLNSLSGVGGGGVPGSGGVIPGAGGVRKREAN